jgi:hypothetical protein
MITCQTATERLVAHWNAPTPQVTHDIQAAIDHVHHCPHCAGRLSVLIRRLAAMVEDAPNCGERTTALPCYVQTGQNASGEEARWQSTGHPHCEVARAEMETLLDLAYADSGQQAQDTPAPDLAFLHPDRSEGPHPEQAP